MKKNNSKFSTLNSKLTIGWFYPDLMSTYGDRGNIMILKKRCEWRGIEVEIKNIFVETGSEEISDCDLLFMGGAQDQQQIIVNNDLEGTKGRALKEKIEQNTPALFVCGAYQFLGKEYITEDKTVIKGLGLFDMVTRHPGGIDNRIVGNIVIEPSISALHDQIVGFENHGGRTKLNQEQEPFATVKRGFGNNKKDKNEGAIYKNAIGTYLHGPVLSKNPELADWLISKALEKKYKDKTVLKDLEDSIEKSAIKSVA